MINALFDLLGMFYQSGDFVQAEWMARSVLLAIPDDIVSLQLLGLVSSQGTACNRARHQLFRQRALATTLKQRAGRAKR